MKNAKWIVTVSLFLVIIMAISVLPTGALSYFWMKSSNAAYTEDYDYSFAIIGDPQDLNRYNPDKMSDMFDWVVANKEEKKIEYVISLGDITDSGSSGSTEMYRGASEHRKLIKNKIPFSLIRGNHDNHALFDKYFTYNLFINGQNYGEGRSAGTFDGTMKNTWQKITIQGHKYLFVNFDYLLDANMVKTINDFLDLPENADYKVIVNTHIYLASGDYWSSKKVQWTDKNKYSENVNKEFFTQGGKYLWDNIFSKHENIEMVLCGHSASYGIEYTSRTGKNGKKINEFLVDPQGIDIYEDGLGLVAMFYFSENGSKLSFEYVSVDRGEVMFPKNGRYVVDLNAGECKYVKAPAATGYKNGQLMFAEDFSDYTKMTELDGYRPLFSANSPIQQTPGYAPNKPNASNNASTEDYIKCEDGKLKVGVDACSTTSSVGAMRFRLYDVPEGVYQYTVVADVKTLKTRDGTTGNSLGIVWADNGMSNARAGSESATAAWAGTKTGGGFRLLWLRVGNSSGVQEGFGQAIVNQTKYRTYVSKDYYVAEKEYTLVMYIDADSGAKTSWFKLIDKANPDAEIEEYAFEAAFDNCYLNTEVGLFFNGGEFEVDQLNVYYGEYDPQNPPAPETDDNMDTQAPDANDNATKPGKNNTGLVIGIIAAVIVVVVASAIVVIVIKKRKNN